MKPSDIARGIMEFYEKEPSHPFKLSREQATSLASAYLAALKALHKLGEKHANMAFVSEVLREIGEEK